MHGTSGAATMPCAFRSLKSGDVIRLDEPLRFSDGAERQTFRISKERLPGANRATTVFT